MDSSKRNKRLPSRQTILSGLIFSCVVILTFSIIIQPWAFREESPSLKLGDVAQQEIRAPKKIEYVSQVRTEEARAEAERAIEPVYAIPDPTVARGQLEKLRSFLITISGVRADQSSVMEDKLSDLLAIEDYGINQDGSNTLLSLTDERWDMVKREASNTLELVMRNPIQSDNLEAVRQGLSSRISLSLSEQEVKLVSELVSPFVAANSFYSPDLTETARSIARNLVEPILISYRQGETIISSGQVVTPLDYEALVVQNLIFPENHGKETLGGGAVVILGMVLMILYMARIRPKFMFDLRSSIIIAILFLVFFASARLSIPNRTIVPYLFPIPAFGLLISSLFGIESGMVLSLVISFLVAYGLPNSLELMAYYFLSTMSAILALGSARRVGHFLRASGVIASVGFLVVTAYRFPFYETDIIGMATLAGAAIFNGIASTSLALLMQFILAQFLGLTTAMQLMEFSRPDFPLLKYFLLRAPGTYQHSLQVVNLAEQAAEKIRADALLTRVGALYHDIGKAENAAFFIENQIPGNVDPHDDIDPSVSAATIIAHVTDGLFLAKKYRLPSRLFDFISEHHGTLLTRYQYNRALELARDDETAFDVEKFRYPGPTPQSRETALIMFADGVEAIVRAKQPNNEEDLRMIVRKVVENAQKEGQLEDTPLTQRDLNVIIESFISTMQGIYHPRLEYPRDVIRIGSNVSGKEEPIIKSKSTRPAKGKGK
jgi:putative nucleotidyltransferase with HDIG domain